MKILRVLKISVVIVLVILLSIADYLCFKKEKKSVYKLEAEDIKQITAYYFGNKSEVLDTEEFLTYYNDVLWYCENTEGIGTTPDTVIEIELVSGEEIGITDSGFNFEINIPGENGITQYWGVQENIENLLKTGDYLTAAPQPNSDGEIVDIVEEVK